MAAPPIIVHVDGGTSRVSVPRPPPMQPLSALLAAAAASLKPPVDPALCTLSINGKPMTGAALETALRFAGVTPGVKVALETPRVRGLGFAAMGTAGGGEEAARGSGGVLSAPRPAVAAASAPAAAAAPEPAQAVPAPPAVPPPAPAASPARPLGRPPLARAPAPPTATTLLDAGCPLGVGVPVAVFTLEDAAAAAAAAAAASPSDADDAFFEFTADDYRAVAAAQARAAAASTVAAGAPLRTAAQRAAAAAAAASAAGAARVRLVTADGLAAQFELPAAAPVAVLRDVAARCLEEGWAVFEWELFTSPPKTVLRAADDARSLHAAGLWPACIVRVGAAGARAAPRFKRALAAARGPPPAVKARERAPAAAPPPRAAAAPAAAAQGEGAAPPPQKGAPKWMRLGK